MTSRRTFLRNTIAGVTVASSPGIFFPKPANSSTLSYLLSLQGTSRAVFNTFVASNISQNVSATLPPATEPAIVRKVETVQQNLQANGFVLNQTPFSQRLGNVNRPLWGKQRNDDLGPNPGFGTIQIRRSEILPISFTGSTTVGIDGAIKILMDAGYDPEDLDNALLPVREGFEDWGTWYGDADPVSGEIVSTISRTSYETRLGSVSRRYEIVEPGKDGFGVIRMDIRGGQRINERIFLEVRFS